MVSIQFYAKAQHKNHDKDFQSFPAFIEIIFRLIIMLLPK